MRAALGLLFIAVACTKVPPTPAAEVPEQRAEPAPALRLAPSPASGVFGTAHPTFVRAFDHTASRWMALCQARADTDGDGKVEVHVGHHGAVLGDDIELYFIIGGGDGTLADHLVDASLDDRWVALVRGDALELVDTETRAVFPLVQADVQDDHRPGVPHRAARFANDRVLFIRQRDSADVLVIHDLATHAERELELPDRIWRFGLADEVAEVYTIPRGQGFPRLWTTLDAGECTGPAASWSTSGQRGPEPTLRYVDLARGIEIEDPARVPAEMPDKTPAKEPVLAGDRLGPVRWR
jgi:hypothetical protein